MTQIINARNVGTISNNAFLGNSVSSVIFKGYESVLHLSVRNYNTLWHHGGTVVTYYYHYHIRAVSTIDNYAFADTALTSVTFGGYR